MTLTEQLSKQAARTVARKQLRKATKELPINPMIKHVGLAALMAAASYLISKKM